MAVLQSHGLTSLLQGNYRLEHQLSLVRSTSGLSRPNTPTARVVSRRGTVARADGRRESSRGAAAVAGAGAVLTSSSALADDSTTSFPSFSDLVSDALEAEGAAEALPAADAAAAAEAVQVQVEAGEVQPDSLLDVTSLDFDAPAAAAASAADTVSDVADQLTLPELPTFSYPTRDVAPSIDQLERKGFSLPEFKKPDFTLPDFSKPSEFTLPDFKSPKFSLPEFKKPDFSSFSLPDFSNPSEFKLPEFTKPDFKLPEFTAPEFKLPNSSDLSLPTPEGIKLPSLPEGIPTPDFQLPTFAFPEIPLPSLPNPSSLPLPPLPRLAVPRAVSEPIERAATAVATSLAERADSASQVAAAQLAQAYSAARGGVPLEYLPVVDRVEENLESFGQAATSFSKEAAVQVGILSAAAVKAAFGAVGYEVDDSVVVATLTLAAAAVIGFASWRAAFGGYSGNLSAAEALALLKETNAVLVDIRDEFVRGEQGVPDLRRGARSKRASVTFEKLVGRLRGDLRNPDVVDMQLMAAKIKGVRGVTKGSHVIVMDESGGAMAKDIARGLATVGFKRSYVLEGGFDSWVASGLRVKPNEAETAAEVVKKEFEAFLEEVQPTPVGVASVIVGTGVGIYALIEWEKSLKIVAFLALAQLLYQRFKSYETEADLQRDIRAVLTPFSLAASATAWAMGSTSSSSSSSSSATTAPSDSQLSEADEKAIAAPTDAASAAAVTVDGAADSGRVAAAPAVVSADAADLAPNTSADNVSPSTRTEIEVSAEAVAELTAGKATAPAAAAIATAVEEASTADSGDGDSSSAASKSSSPPPSSS